MVLSDVKVLSLFTQKSIDWELVDGKIKKSIQFRNFDDAFDFMAEVAAICKKDNHHPYWTNEYNKVSIEFVTHSSGGITMKDIDLAEKIDGVLASRQDH